MYSFAPSDEQKMLVEAVGKYASANLRPKAHDADEEGQLPPKLIETGWELGVLQASIPEEYGGFGDRSAVTGVLAAEELAWGDLSGALAVMAPSLFAVPILLAGTAAQKETYLARIAEAEWQPFTAALVEPRYDFDPNDLHTTAVVSGDGYVLKGHKTMVPFADRAEAMIVYARVGTETQGFIVQTDAEGLVVGAREKTLGLGGVPLFGVDLNGVQVAAADRLGGPEGHDFAPILAASRVAAAALGVGLSRAAFEYARDYAKNREVFGVKVAQKQAIAFMLAEMATEIEAIRLLTWEAAWALDQGKEDASKSAYLAFLGSADMAMMVTDRAVQVLGGHGYIREYPVEMFMRNGRGIASLTGLAIV